MKTKIIKKCRKCDEVIPAGRLEILPNTEYCVRCADSVVKRINDPEYYCAKSSHGGQNGFAKGE